MNCKHPVKIRPKYRGMNRVQMTEEEFDKKFPLGHIIVPCGKCLACKIARSREWSLRCMHELTFSSGACFVTLTYDDAHLPDNFSLVKDHFVKFLKRLRKRLSEKGMKNVRYYACGEYGEMNHRPHYHAIIFNLSPHDALSMIGIHHDPHYSGWCKDPVWNSGFIDVGDVTYDSIRYTTQYIDKKFTREMNKRVYLDTGRIPPFQLCSTGIGRKFCDRDGDRMREDLYTSYLGVRYSIPRYYRKRLKIDSEALKKPMLDKYLERYDHRLKRPGINTVNDVHASLQLSREQHNKTLEAKLNMKRKKL